ncbi:hypothetical protein ACLQ18_32110 [Streptomyces sp. DT193]|uniref:hypothetical protein n=1 Tax=Streptomyces sp. DT193 TaxID=3393418 RepID=UPI003CED20B2
MLGESDPRPKVHPAESGVLTQGPDHGPEGPQTDLEGGCLNVNFSTARLKGVVAEVEKDAERTRTHG